MNKKLENINPEELLFFDIETVRGYKEFDENHPNYEVWAWKQRNRDNNEIPPSKEVIDAYYNKAALSSEWNRVAVISMGYILDNQLRIKSLVGDEVEILKDFVNIVKGGTRRLCGYNIIGFDLPTVRRRFVINNLTNYLSERQGNDSGDVKPWIMAESVLDLMLEWKGTGYYSTSMEEVAMTLGIGSKSDIHGNMTSELFYNGEVDRLVKYCEEDVLVTANIFMKLKGLDTISAAETNNAKEKEDKVNIFRLLHNNESLSEDITEKLLEVYKDNPDAKRFELLVRSALYRINPHFGGIDQRGAELEVVESEIEELLNRIK